MDSKGNHNSGHRSLQALFEEARVASAPTTPLEQRPTFGFASPPIGSTTMEVTPKMPPMRVRGKSCPSESDNSPFDVSVPKLGDDDKDDKDKKDIEHHAATATATPTGPTFKWDKYVVPGFSKPALKGRCASSSKVPVSNVPDHQTEITNFFPVSSVLSAPTSTSALDAMDVVDSMDQGDQGGESYHGDVITSTAAVAPSEPMVQTPTAAPPPMKVEAEEGEKVTMGLGSAMSAMSSHADTIPAAQRTPRTPEETPPPPSTVEQATQPYVSFPGYGPRPVLPPIPESFQETTEGATSEGGMKSGGCESQDGDGDGVLSPQLKQPRLTYEQSMSSPSPLALPSPCHCLDHNNVLQDTTMNMDDEKVVVTIAKPTETKTSETKTSETETSNVISNKDGMITDETVERAVEESDILNVTERYHMSVDSDQAESNESEESAESSETVSVAHETDPTGHLSQALVGPLVSPFGVLPPPRIVRSVEDAFNWPKHFFDRMKEAGGR